MRRWIFFLLFCALVLWAGGRFIRQNAFRARVVGISSPSPAAESTGNVYPFSTFVPGFVQDSVSPAPETAQPQVDARAAGLVNMTMQDTVWAQNKDEEEGIASLTKLMTALLARQYASSSMQIVLQPDDLNVDSVNKDLHPGDRFTVNEALHFLLISSDNAMAHAVGRTVFQGGIPEFVRRMNQTAQDLGMTHTRYEDPIGLGNDVSSVSDLALFSGFIETHYPDLFSFSKYAHLTMVTEQGRVFDLNNTNVILNQIPGFIGSKTGYTPETGGSLLVVFETSRGKFVSIVLGSPDRFGDTSAILSWYSRKMSDTLR